MRIYKLGPDLQPCRNITDTDIHVLVLQNGEECELLESYGINDVSLRVPEDISFCKAESHHLYTEGNLCIPRREDIRGKRERVLFYVTRDLLVFVGGTELTERVLDRARANPKDQLQCREKLLYDYFVLLMENDASLLREMESAIFQLEEEVTDGKCDDFQSHAQDLRRKLLILREYYAGLSDMAEEFEDNDNGICDEDNLTYFGIIYGRAERLLERANRLVEYLSQVQDANREQLAEKQNRNMNYLTVVSTLFLPLTLITGWFGMNFENMPELENGYPWVIGASLFIVLLIILLFKRKKIL